MPEPDVDGVAVAWLVKGIKHFRPDVARRVRERGGQPAPMMETV